MRIAYLVNRYPAVSHSFIRREILAVEEAGLEVKRFSIRAADQNLPDPQDRNEAELTTNILAQGVPALIYATFRVFIEKPGRFFSAMALATRAFVAEPRHGWRHFIYLVEACWLARNLSGVDHLHVHFGTNPAAVARLVKYLAGIPFSLTVHGPDEFDAPAALDLRGKIADARAVMAISSYCRSQLMRWSDPTDWSKIIVMRCGVDRLFTLEPALIERKASTFCCVARLSPQKGLPLLIEAARRLAESGQMFQLVLVGDGEMRAELERTIALNNLQSYVKITGFVGSTVVRDIVASSLAMVLPSFAEGLPVVIMESLAMQTPVIVSAIAGTPELVNEQCGWLIPAGSIEALTQAMTAALSEPQQSIRTKGSIGRQRVLHWHDASKNGRTLVEHFLSWK